LLELEAAPWAGRMTAGVRMDGPLSHAGFQMAPTPHLNAECAVISRTRKTKAHETKAEQATHELPVLERGPASFVRQTQTAPLRKEGVCTRIPPVGAAGRTCAFVSKEKEEGGKARKDTRSDRKRRRPKQARTILCASHLPSFRGRRDTAPAPVLPHKRTGLYISRRGTAPAPVRPHKRTGLYIYRRGAAPAPVLPHSRTGLYLYRRGVAPAPAHPRHLPQPPTS